MGNHEHPLTRAVFRSVSCCSDRLQRDRQCLPRACWTPKPDRPGRISLNESSLIGANHLEPVLVRSCTIGQRHQGWKIDLNVCEQWSLCQVEVQLGGTYRASPLRFDARHWTTLGRELT